MSFEAWRYAAEEGRDPYALADEAAAQAPSRAQWDCARGCAHCCHLKVEVTPFEAEALSRIATPEITLRIRRNAAATRGLGAAAYRALRIPCAFLSDDGACLAYDVRPLRCRAHVSTSEPSCAAVLRGEEDRAPGDDWLATAVQAIHAGLGGELTELHQALAESSRP